MGISPLYKGDQPLMHNIIKQDNGNPFPLTGLISSNITFYLITPSGLRAGTGTFTITDPVNGLCDYQWSTADSAQAGNFISYIKIDLPTGSRRVDPQTISIIDLLG